MSKKHSYEFVKSIFDSRNFKLLSKEYENCDTPLKYICSKHNNVVQTIRFSSLRTLKNGCKYCGYERTANARRISYDVVKNAFENKNLELLTKEYKNDSTPLEFKCLIHKDIIQTVNYDSLRSKNVGCRICGRINQGNNNPRKLNFEDIKNIFELKGYKLLDNDYNNSHAKLKYICPIHPDNIQYISITNLKHNKGCRYCGIEKAAKSKRILYKDILNSFNDKDLTLLSSKYINYKTKLKFKCNKHPEIIQHICYGNLLKDFYSCKICRNDAVKGQNNWNWNPNLSDEERITQRKYEEYKIWRKNVFERDKYTCQICGIIGKKLNAHHLNSYSNNPESRVDINNGITLCKNCHLNFHKLYGFKNSTKIQFDNYIFKLNDNECEVI
jgi:hypothetical protein